MSSDKIKAAEAKLDSAFKTDFKTNSVDSLFKMQVAVVFSILPVFLYIILLLVVTFYFLKATIFQLIDVIQSGVPFYIVAYIVFVCVLGSLLYCFVRPLLRIPTKSKALELGVDREPNIYACVNTITNRLKLDPVNRICISSEVIVDVRYDSIKDFKESKLTLTLGLPLIVSLKTHELVALLAHEFGRYSDSKVRQLYFVQRWLLNRLFELTEKDDPLIVKIDRITERMPSLNPIFIPTRVFVQFASSAVNVVQNLVQTISRDFVYDVAFFADEYQAQVVGSRQFDVQLKHLVQIDQAYHSTCEQIISGEKKPKNIADLLIENYGKNQVPVNQFIEMAPSEEFSTGHLMPTPSSRTRRMLQKEIEACYTLEYPVAKLFGNIVALGEQLTQEFYERHELDADRVEDFSQENDKSMQLPLPKEEEILRVYASGLFRRDIVWAIPSDNKLEALEDEKIIPFLNKVVLSIRHSLPDFVKCFDLIDEYNRNSQEYHFYQWLVKNGCKNRPSVESMEGARLITKDFEEKFIKKIDAYCKSYGVRVSAAVELGKEAKAYKSAKNLLKLLSKLSQIQIQVRDSKVKASTLKKLLVRRSEGEQEHQQTISRLTRMIYKVIQSMEAVTGNLPESLLGNDIHPNIHARALDAELLSGKDFEGKVIERFNELLKYYEAYNVVLSAKLAQFVGLVERKREIEAVAKVSLS